MSLALYPWANLSAPYSLADEKTHGSASVQTVLQRRGDSTPAGGVAAPRRGHFGGASAATSDRGGDEGATPRIGQDQSRSIFHRAGHEEMRESLELCLY